MTAIAEKPTTSRDPYARISDLDDATVAALAQRFEIRASDHRQHQLWRDFLGRAPVTPDAIGVSDRHHQPRVVRQQPQMVERVAGPHDRRLPDLLDDRHSVVRVNEFLADLETNFHCGQLKLLSEDKNC